MELPSRVEDYLAYMIGESVDLPYPKSRVEYYLRYICENGIESGGGVLVKLVNGSDTMPTTRSDGSPLQNEDYVKPKQDATFPFTINGVEFVNRFSKAIYFNGEWVVDAGLIQDTSETPVFDIAKESLSKTKKFQSGINEEIVKIIGQLETIGVDNCKTLIESVNWLYEHGLKDIELEMDFTDPVKDKMIFKAKDQDGNYIVDECLDFTDKLVLQVKVQEIKNKTINADYNTITDLEVDNFKPDVVREVLRDKTLADDISLPTEKAVRDQLIDNTEFELDETGVKDKLKLIVKNVLGDKVIDEDIDIDKVIIRVDELPTTDINEVRFYLLKQEVGDYKAGLYYPTKQDDGTYLWIKVGSGDDIEYVEITDDGTHAGVITEEDFEKITEEGACVILDGRICRRSKNGTDEVYFNDVLISDNLIIKQIRVYKDGTAFKWTVETLEEFSSIINVDELPTTLVQEECFYLLDNHKDDYDLSQKLAPKDEYKDIIKLSDEGFTDETGTLITWEEVVADSDVRNKYFEPNTDGAIFVYVHLFDGHEVMCLGEMPPYYLYFRFKNAWKRVGSGKGGSDTIDEIVYVDELPTDHINDDIFYYLKEDTEDHYKGLYYAAKQEDGTYLFRYLEANGMVAVEDELTGIITFENGTVEPDDSAVRLFVIETEISTGVTTYFDRGHAVADPLEWGKDVYKSSRTEDEIPLIREIIKNENEPGHLDRLDYILLSTKDYEDLAVFECTTASISDEGELSVGPYKYIRVSEDGTRTYVSPKNPLTESLHVVEYLYDMDATVAESNQWQPGMRRDFEINITLEGYEPTAILNPRVYEHHWSDVHQEIDSTENASVLMPSNVKFKIGDKNKIFGGLTNVSPLNKVWWYGGIAVTILYVKK